MKISDFAQFTLNNMHFFVLFFQLFFRYGVAECIGRYPNKVNCPSS